MGGWRGLWVVLPPSSGDEMFKFKVERRQGDVLHEAYDRLPRPALTPREAFERLMAGRGGGREGDHHQAAMEGRTGRQGAEREGGACLCWCMMMPSSGESEPVGLSELEGRVAAVSVIPYPPGTTYHAPPACCLPGLTTGVYVLGWCVGADGLAGTHQASRW